MSVAATGTACTEPTAAPGTVVVPAGMLAAAAKDTARVQSKPPLAMLAGVRVAAVNGSLELARTDFEVSLLRRIRCTGSWGAPVVVDATLLKSSAARLAAREPVTLTVTADRLVLTQGTRRVGLPLLAADDFPTLPPVADPAAAGFTLTGATLNLLARKLTVFASRDEFYPTLAGVHLEAAGGVLQAGATDRFRAALIELPVQTPVNAAPVSALVPNMALVGSLFAADEQVAAVVTETDRHLHLVGEATTCSVRLLDGDFPKVDKLFPSTATLHATFDPAAFVEAVQFVAATAGRDVSVHVDCGDGRLRLTNTASADGPEVSDLVPADVSGPDSTFGLGTRFWPRTVLDAVTVWGKGHPVTMHCTRGTGPVEFTSDALPGMRVLVMPAREPVR